MPAMQRRAAARGDVGAVEADCAGIGRDAAGDQVEQRGLAGAVRPDDSERLARRDRRSILSATITEPKLSQSLDFQQHARDAVRTMRRARSAAMMSADRLHLAAAGMRAQSCCR